MKKTINDYSQMIDHTNLKPDASLKNLKKLCEEAKKYNFRMVAINSEPVQLCKSFLKDSEVHVGAAISFPLGQTTIETKVFETKNAIDNGADEIDYVLNIRELKSGNKNYIKEEMEAIVGLCKQNDVLSKVILETCYLSDEEIIQACEIARIARPNFVKTSTGFGTAGAKVEDVRLMKSIVGEEVEVKASGGIRNVDSFLAMIEAGATRIGTSSSISILESLKKEIS